LINFKPFQEKNKNQGQDRHVDEDEGGISKRTLQKVEENLVKPVGVQVVPVGLGVGKGVLGWDGVVLNNPLARFKVGT
jgi:hypothetical protein